MRAPLALADREVGDEPRYADYANPGEHTAAWHYWRAVRRDAYPTAAELDARTEALGWAIQRRARGLGQTMSATTGQALASAWVAGYWLVERRFRELGQAVGETGEQFAARIRSRLASAGTASAEVLGCPEPSESAPSQAAPN